MGCVKAPSVIFVPKWGWGGKPPVWPQDEGQTSALCSSSGSAPSVPLASSPFAPRGLCSVPSHQEQHLRLPNPLQPLAPQERAWSLVPVSRGACSRALGGIHWPSNKALPCLLLSHRRLKSAYAVGPWHLFNCRPAKRVSVYMYVCASVHVCLCMCSTFLWLP